MYSSAAGTHIFLICLSLSQQINSNYSDRGECYRGITRWIDPTNGRCCKSIPTTVLVYTPHHNFVMCSTIRTRTTSLYLFKVVQYNTGQLYNVCKYETFNFLINTIDTTLAVDQQLLLQINCLNLVQHIVFMLRGVCIQIALSPGLLSGLGTRLAYRLSNAVLHIIVCIERSDSRGALRITGQDAVYGSSPSVSRYLNLNRQSFRLYLGMILTGVQD